MAEELIDGEAFRSLGLRDWTEIQGRIEARFATGDFATGLEFVNQIGDVAERADHHPDIHLSYSAVHLVLWSHDVGGLTQRDVNLARMISMLAFERSLPSQPDR